MELLANLKNIQTYSSNNSMVCNLEILNFDGDN